MKIPEEEVPHWKVAYPDLERTFGEILRVDDSETPLVQKHLQERSKKMVENGIPVLLRNGNLLVLAAFEYGDVVGDGLIEVVPDTEEYKMWMQWMQAKNLSLRLAESKDSERALSGAVSS